MENIIEKIKKLEDEAGDYKNTPAIMAVAYAILYLANCIKETSSTKMNGKLYDKI